jgi:nicotinate-nucleotide adenylyltransferase
MSDEAPIGLLGGTFDPVHEGHLRLGEAAQNALRLARLVWLPAGQPWQKGRVSATDDRVAMLSLALVARPKNQTSTADWSIDAREAHRAGASYTIDTVRELRAEFGSRQPLVWILGSDQLQALPTWKRWQELLDFVHIAYVHRPGSKMPSAGVMQEYVRTHAGTIQDLPSRPAGTMVSFPMVPFDCSSTAIRDSIVHGRQEEIRTQVPAPVLAYIQSHNLYLQDHGQ